jgi:hypothetical protein
LQHIPRNLGLHGIHVVHQVWRTVDATKEDRGREEDYNEPAPIFQECQNLTFSQIQIERGSFVASNSPKRILNGIAGSSTPQSGPYANHVFSGFFAYFRLTYKQTFPRIAQHPG